MAFRGPRKLETELRSGKSNQVSAFSAPWIRQKTSDGDTIIGARAVLNQGLELADAVFFSLDEEGDIVERRTPRAPICATATGNCTTCRRFRDGEQAAAARNRPGRHQSQPGIRPGEGWRGPKRFPSSNCPAKIEVARSFGLSANAFAMQFHSLMALPLLLVAMTLIAATVSMRFARMGQSATMILGGVVAGFLLYVVSVLVKAFGNAGFVPPFVAAWIPVVVAMFFGVTFLLYKEDG